MVRKKAPKKAPKKTSKRSSFSTPADISKAAQARKPGRQIPIDGTMPKADPKLDALIEDWVAKRDSRMAMGVEEKAARARVEQVFRDKIEKGEIEKVDGQPPRYENDVFVVTLVAKEEKVKATRKKGGDDSDDGDDDE